MIEAREEINELADVISVFMVVVPGNPEEGEREWSSVDMAKAIVDAGYRKVDPEKWTLIDVKELQKAFEKQGYQYHYITPTNKILLQSQLDHDREAGGYR